jgi:hypothetical protein
MARDASLLVTSAPATTSSRVQDAVNTARRSRLLEARIRLTDD